MYQLKQEAISAAFHHLWGHCQEWGACRSSAVYFSPSSLLKIILNLGCGGCPRMCFLLQGGGVISVWWRLAWERNGTVMLSDPINPLLFLTVSPCCCTRRRGFGGRSTAPRWQRGELVWHIQPGQPTRLKGMCWVTLSVCWPSHYRVAPPFRILYGSIVSCKDGEVPLQMRLVRCAQRARTLWWLGTFWCTARRYLRPF